MSLSPPPASPFSSIKVYDLQVHPRLLDDGARSDAHFPLSCPLTSSHPCSSCPSSLSHYSLDLLHVPELLALSRAWGREPLSKLSCLFPLIIPMGRIYIMIHLRYEKGERNVLIAHCALVNTFPAILPPRPQAGRLPLKRKPACSGQR